MPFATGILRDARKSGDFAAASVAARALGLAALHLQHPDAAIRHLRAAAALGQQAGSAALAAEARMRLAFVLNVRGRPLPAIREIDAVLKHLDGASRARAQAQRAAIMHQLGRLDEALAGYRAALPVLRQAADTVWVKRVLSNRGVLHGQRHEFAAAEADLTEAERLCRQLDQDLTLAFIQQNLGWVCGRRGDVPRALAYLDQAEQRLRSLRSQLGWVLTDRCELLLSVGLVTEARQAAELAVGAFERERREIALPEVRLLLASAASAVGDFTEAQEQARRAVREFTRQQRPEWAALARFAVLTARQAAWSAGTNGAGAAGQAPDDPPRPPADLDAAGPAGVAVSPRTAVSVGEAERAADALAAEGWRSAALDARLMAGQLAIGRGWTNRGRRQLEQAAAQRHHGSAALRSRAWHAEALLRYATGNLRGADRAVRAALRIIDEHHATFGATDLRAHASGRRVDVARLGLRMALLDGRPAKVLTAAERGRASHLLMPPARPPEDVELAEALAELRATVAELGKLRSAAPSGPPASAARLAQRQVVLERQIRDHCRRRAHDGDVAASSRPVPARLLAEALYERALVEFVHLDGIMYAVTMAGGRVRLRQLGPLAPIRELADRIPFALRLLGRATTSDASRAAALTLLEDAASGLDNILLAPLAGQLAGRPLVLVPTDPLHALPWSTLPSCAGRPVTVSPSAALWFAARAAGRDPGTSALVRAVVVAGPRLPGARAEAATVAAIHSTTPLDGPAATVAATMNALNGAGLAHLAAHGRVHADNPLFSALLLADGPLTAYDLERLHALPKLVILAACDSGRLVVRAGDELLGLTATLLARGTRQIIAAVVPLPDMETRPLMVELHRLLVRGEDPPAALAKAQELSAKNASPAAAAAAGFVCLGG